jgi:hypothetical protein
MRLVNEWQAVRLRDRIRDFSSRSRSFPWLTGAAALNSIALEALNIGQDLTARQISNNTFGRGDVGTNSLQNEPNRYCE